MSGGKDLCYLILLFCFKLEVLKPFRHSANYVSFFPPTNQERKCHGLGSLILRALSAPKPGEIDRLLLTSLCCIQGQHLGHWVFEFSY